MNFHGQDILLFLLWVFDNSEADIFVTECFSLSDYLPKLIKLIYITVLLHRPFSPVSLNQGAVISVLCYNDINSVTAVAAVLISTLIHIFVKEVIVISGCIIVIRVKKVMIVLRIIINVIIIIILQTIKNMIIIIMFVLSFWRLFILVGLFCYPKGVFTDLVL